MVSPGPGSAFKDPPHLWHVRGAPHVSLFEGPRVDRAAVANQLEQAWLAKLLGRPLVHALQPRDDHRVVEQPPKALLVGDIACRRRAQADSGLGARGGVRGTLPPSRAGGRRAGGRAGRTVPAPGAAPQRARARRGTRASATFMKKRSGGLSASARRGGPDRRPRCSRRGLGRIMRRRFRDELHPQPHGLRRRLAPRSAAPSGERRGDSHPSRSRRSLTALHHTLPGGEQSSGSSTPRCACQRMNERAARRNGR